MKKLFSLYYHAGRRLKYEVVQVMKKTDLTLCGMFEDETSTCHLLSWILYLLFSNL